MINTGMNISSEEVFTGKVALYALIQVRVFFLVTFAFSVRRHSLLYVLNCGMLVFVRVDLSFLCLEEIDFHLSGDLLDVGGLIIFVSLYVVRSSVALLSEIIHIVTLREVLSLLLCRYIRQSFCGQLSVTDTILVGIIGGYLQLGIDVNVCFDLCVNRKYVIRELSRMLAFVQLTVIWCSQSLCVGNLVLGASEGKLLCITVKLRNDIRSSKLLEIILH